MINLTAEPGMRNKIILIGLLVLAGAFLSEAQLSQGGFPRYAGLKQSLTPERLPAVSNEVLRWQNQQSQPLLKYLRFAHPFEVRITPSTHGTWFRSSDGWHIWQVAIRSEGAFSLNLLFENFHLPEKARLFLFTPGYSGLLGAFTSGNNTEEGVLPVSPLPGDELVVQYEIPGPPPAEDDFIITKVNHDYLGILKWEEKRRPLGLSGSCNPDINCGLAANWRSVQNATCRLIIQGSILCTGTLLNNTAENRRPFVATANHCVSSNYKAQETLYLFNYESPYCGSIDGDLTHSIAGGKLKATFDSLDFSLVELNVAPPPAFRPYYAGWTRETQVSDTLATVHHPLGDIKKIAIDHNIPVISTFYPTFLNDAFWKILRWEVGTTENGSSGGPFFNRKGLFFGTLSGGEASCSNPVNDYFARFNLAWDYRSDSTRQLKYWLDPEGNNPLSLAGRQFFEKEELCAAFTNLKEGDTHQMLRYNGASGGYWTGTNDRGYTEIADLFSVGGDEQIRGISLGVGRKVQKNRYNNSYISLRVYNFSNQTATLIFSKDSVMLNKLAANAMNLIEFDQAIEPADSFLVAFNLENIREGDTLAIFHSLRNASQPGTLWLRKGQDWKSFPAEHPTGLNASLALEVTACNFGPPSSKPPVADESLQLQVYPNPAVSKVHIWSKEAIPPENVTLYDMRGRQVRCRIEVAGPLHLEVDLSGNLPGLYLVKVRYRAEYIQSKFLLIPY